MEGFINCNSVLNVDTEKDMLVQGTEMDKLMEWQRMSESGLIPNEELGCYIGEQGAYMGNISEEVTDLEARDYYKRYLDNGYDLVIGPGAPGKNGEVIGNGVYCQNYQELLEAQKGHQR